MEMNEVIKWSMISLLQNCLQLLFTKDIQVNKLKQKIGKFQTIMMKCKKTDQLMFFHGTCHTLLISATLGNRFSRWLAVTTTIPYAFIARCHGVLVFLCNVEQRTLQENLSDCEGCKLLFRLSIFLDLR